MSLSDEKRAYDAACKAVLAEREILAYILWSCVPEFAGCSIKDIAAKYIAGEPKISAVEVEPGRLRSPGVEDTSEDEGTVRFDIWVRAIAPKDGKHIGLIINLEAQHKFHPGYPLLKRGVYYGCRLVSRQYGTTFKNAEYEKIEKVYSIWICTNPPQGKAYTVNEFSITERQLVGDAQYEREHYDLMTVIMFCLGDKPYTELAGTFKLLQMLLLDNDTPMVDKRRVLGEEFKVELTPRLQKGVASMCNLSDGVFERGEARGFQRGEAHGEARGFQRGETKAYAGMIHDGLITEQQAAARLQITVPELNERIATLSA